MSIFRRPWSGRRIAGTVAALAALTGLVTVIGDADTDATAEPTGGRSAVSVPAPPANSSVVTVKTGGDRTGTDTVDPLPGVTLALFADDDDADPIAQPWATCTSDADGDCNFIVPDTQSGGANRDARLWVRQTAVPSGWFANPELRTGPGDGTGSQSNTYQFQTPQLQSGNTYSSTSNFMISNSNNRTASGGVWQQSRENPTLTESCGLDTAILLDLSNSVAPALPQLKSATDTIVDALVGTPSRVALFSFGTNAPGLNGANLPDLVPVSTQAGADGVKSSYAGWSTNGGTNWDQGLLKVAQADPFYDLVLIITDGNPTFFSSPSQGNGSDTRFREVEQGIFSANAVKEEGTRIAAVGVGTGVQGSSGLNLRALSGPIAYPGSPPDYFQTTDYAQAAAIIRALALGRCEGTLSIVKQLVPAGTTGEDITGATPAGPGWEFDGSTTVPGIGGLPATKTTTDDGTGAVSFPLTYPGGTTTAGVKVNEIQHDGFELVTQGGSNAVCTNLTTATPVPVVDDDVDPTEPGFTVDVPSSAAVSCTVYNRPAPADATVDKEWIVDGTTYADGEQPAGLEADLTLTGPGDADATPQPWGTTRTGYVQQETATIDETTSIGNGCTLGAARVTEANGNPVEEALPYDATLTLEHNTYTVTNTVTCPQPTTTTTSTSTTSTTSTTTPTSTTSTTKPTPPTTKPAPPPPAPPKRHLPKTGSSATGVLAALGLGLLAAGLPLAVWARRRSMGSPLG